MFFKNIKQINRYFKKKNFFFLNGKDIFLINENKKLIIKIFKKNNIEYINIKINNKTNWDNIHLFCQNNNFLINKKILFLEFENNIENNKIFKKILKIFKIFNKIVIMVLIGLYLTSFLKNYLINNNIYKFIIDINCKKNIFKNWAYLIFRKIKLKLNSKFKNLLFNCFENNFIELSQFLELLLLIYPDYNINIINIKKLIYNSSYFTFFNFIKNFLIGNINNSLNNLKKIRKEKIEPLLLINILKKELIIIMKIKFYKNNKILYKNLNIKKIFNYKMTLYNIAIKRLLYNDFNNAFLILSKIENLLKTKNILFWNEIKNLLLLICK